MSMRYKKQVKELVGIASRQTHRRGRTDFDGSYGGAATKVEPTFVVPEGFSKNSEMIRNTATNKLQRRPTIAPYAPRQVQVTSKFLSNYKKSSEVNTELTREIANLE